MSRNTDIPDELSGMGSILTGIPRTMPYSLPSGYFENFEAEITDLAKSLDAEEGISAPNLKAPFADLPAGYFEQFPEKALRIAKGVETKTIPLSVNPSRRLFTFGRVRWAAAAVLIIALGIGSYTILFRHSESIPEKMLSSVSGNELHEYLQSSCRMDVDRIVNNNSLANLELENKDIIKYLDETGWDVVD